MKIKKGGRDIKPESEGFGGTVALMQLSIGPTLRNTHFLGLQAIRAGNGWTVSINCLHFYLPLSSLELQPDSKSEGGAFLKPHLPPPWMEPCAPKEKGGLWC